jgi:hypothetical protein
MWRWLQNFGLVVIPLGFLWIMAALGGPNLVLSVIAGVFLAVLVHEAGHAFAGALSGMRVTTIVLGPVALDCATGKVQPRWNRSLRASGVLIFEPSEEPSAKAIAAWRLTLLAGPLANFLLAILLAWLNLIVFTGRPDAQIKLAIVAIISAVMGAVSLIPLSWGLTSSDGAILRRIWDGGSVAEDVIRAHQMGKWLASSSQPCQWPAADLATADFLIGAPPSTLDPHVSVTAVLVKYWYLADCGDLPAALNVLENAVRGRTLVNERSPMHPIDLVIVLLARHYALWGNDTARALMLLDMLHPFSWVRSGSEWQATTALVKLGEGNRAEALSTVTEARHRLKPFVARFGVAKIEADWLEKAEQRIRSQITAPAVAPAALEKADPISQPAAFASHRPPRLTAVELQPEPKPIARTPRNAGQDVAVAFSRFETATPRKVVSEIDVNRSWLYRSPGIPLEPSVALARVPLPSPRASIAAPHRLMATR